MDFKPLQELTARYDWFNPCISNIKFYRLESELNAQFVSDAVHSAKLNFNRKIEALKEDLKQAGLNKDSINKILSTQKFEYEGITDTTAKLPHTDDNQK